jgi:uncharacterized membrane protein
VIWLLLACTGAGGDTGTCARQPPLDWAGFGQGFMEKHCTGCHSSLLRDDQRDGAPVGVDLDTWDDVVRWGPRIEARALSAEPDMPPGGGPSEEERRLLQEWLDCTVLPAGEAQ